MANYVAPHNFQVVADGNTRYLTFDASSDVGQENRILYMPNETNGEYVVMGTTSTHQLEVPIHVIGTHLTKGESGYEGIWGKRGGPEKVDYSIVG